MTLGTPNDAKALSSELQAAVQALVANAVQAEDAAVLEEGLGDLCAEHLELSMDIVGYALSILPEDRPREFCEILGRERCVDAEDLEAAIIAAFASLDGNRPRGPAVSFPEPGDECRDNNDCLPIAELPSSQAASATQ